MSQSITACLYVGLDVHKDSLSRNTIKKWLKSGAGAVPKYRRRKVPIKLEAYVEPLLQALRADAQRPQRKRRTVKALHVELKAAVYAGGHNRGSTLRPSTPGQYSIGTVVRIRSARTFVCDKGIRRHRSRRDQPRPMARQSGGFWRTLARPHAADVRTQPRNGVNRVAENIKFCVEVLDFFLIEQVVVGADALLAAGLNKHLGLAMFGGNVPLVENGQTIGGVGVSGGSAEQDGICARAAVAMLGL